MIHQVTMPGHGEEEISSLPEWKMTLHMRQEGRVKFHGWVEHCRFAGIGRAEEARKSFASPSRERVCHSK